MRNKVEVKNLESRASILVVEAEGIFANELVTDLYKGGYQVAGIASSGEEALHKLLHLRPQLMIVDVGLVGEINGIELARLVQERFEIPIIYLTGQSEKATLDRAAMIGTFAYLSKPVRQECLVTSIELALFRHSAEYAMRQEREWLHTVLGTMVDGIIVTDESGCVGYLNPHAEELTGWVSADAHRKPVEIVLPLLDLSLGLTENELLRTAIANRTSTRLPFGLHGANREGTPFPIEGEVAPSGSSQQSFGAVISFRNSTERLKKEHAVRYELKMEVLCRLAGAVAHDINGLLPVIGGLTEMAFKNVERERVELVREVLRASHAARSVTSKLTALSTRQLFHPQPENWNAIVRDNEHKSRQLLGGRITLSATLPADLGDVYADSNALTEILMNLVTNASEAMPDGGYLTIKTENVDVNIPSSPVPETVHYVSLVVEDNGLGMDANVAEHLFEPFFTTKVPMRGAGLSLAIVDFIVRELNGFIDVDSEPGLGSTFTVYLPRLGAPNL